MTCGLAIHFCACPRSRFARAAAPLLRRSRPIPHPGSGLLRHFRPFTNNVTRRAYLCPRAQADHFSGMGVQVDYFRVARDPTGANLFGKTWDMSS